MFGVLRRIDSNPFGSRKMVDKRNLLEKKGEFCLINYVISYIGESTNNSCRQLLARGADDDKLKYFENKT